MKDFEEQRLKYRPKKIKLLFIAESRPSNGTFFYFPNSNLFDAIKEGFQRCYLNCGDGYDFLDFFKKRDAISKIYVRFQ